MYKISAIEHPFSTQTLHFPQGIFFSSVRCKQHLCSRLVALPAFHLHQLFALKSEFALSKIPTTPGTPSISFIGQPSIDTAINTLPVQIICWACGQRVFITTASGKCERGWLPAIFRLGFSSSSNIADLSLNYPRNEQKYLITRNIVCSFSPASLVSEHVRWVSEGCNGTA